MSEAEVCTAVKMGMKVAFLHVSALFDLLQEPLVDFALLKTLCPQHVSSQTSSRFIILLDLNTLSFCTFSALIHQISFFHRGKLCIIYKSKEMTFKAPDH